MGKGRNVPNNVQMKAGNLTERDSNHQNCMLKFKFKVRLEVVEQGGTGR
jgi:hypothetical protein